MTSKSLVIDNSIETGPVNFTFLNNREEAKQHMYDARKFLASVKSKYGVYDRVAAGDPGGFFHESIDLPDGTRISVSTNDGVDTAIIAAPSRVIEKEEKEEEPEFNPTIGDDFFVGIRYISGGLPVKPRNGYSTVESDAHYSRRHVVPHLCLWVPERKRDGSDERLIVSNRNTLLGIDLSDDEQFATGGFVSRPHYEDEKQFPIGIFKSDTWVVKEGVQEEDIFWDVRITHVSRPPQGNYDVKVCIVGGDCLVTTPAEFELVMALGHLYVSKRFTISEFSASTRLIMPRGFFWVSEDGGGKEDWYWENDVAPFGNTSSPFAFGANPHGPNWWEGGFSAYLDHEPIKKKNFSFINIVEPENNDGKPFLVDGCFEERATTDYSDPRKFYKFTGPFEGFPPLNDRCTDAVGTTVKRQWAKLPLSTAGQNVAVSSARLCTAECAAVHPERCGESLGTQVFLNLGSANEGDLLVDIPGAASGTMVTFTSVTSNRTISATVANLPGSVIGAGIKIGSKGIPCVYGIIDLSDDFDPDYDNELTDYFFLSFVTTTSTVTEGPPFYYRATRVSVVVDNPFSPEPLNIGQDGETESGAFPFLEAGAFPTLGGPETSGYYDLLEKFWAVGR